MVLFLWWLGFGEERWDGWDLRVWVELCGCLRCWICWMVVGLVRMEECRSWLCLVVVVVFGERGMEV